MSWEDEFRVRIIAFEGSHPAEGKGIPLSIKVRVTSGCFHRQHSPNAYRIIDGYLHSHPSAGFLFEEHESGPELLVYVALGAAGLNLSASIINLVTTIIKARSDGIKLGDDRRAPIELIVRGFDESGNMKEETILRIDPQDTVVKESIEKALRHSVNKMFKTAGKKEQKP